MSRERIINKTMELSDLQSDKSKMIIAELNDLISMLNNKKLKTSSWFGRFNLSGEKDSLEYLNRGYNYEPLAGAADDRNFPWFLYWEIVWVISNAEFKKEQKVLDLGGSSSLFSYYLASKGLDVTTVDLKNELVENANHVAQKTGWHLKNYCMDIRKLDLECQFDHITSICVFEHIPMYDRIDINKHIKRLLAPEGRFSITFDYRNPSRLARISTSADVYEQFVKPSGLRLRENQCFFDTGISYLLHPFFHPAIPLRDKLLQIRTGHFLPWDFFRSKSVNDYTFGALFQEK